jgi:putative FmdB family regulatory protein
MPFYDFECSGCGFVTEEVFSIMSMPDSVECGDCGEESFRTIKNQNMEVQWNTEGKTPVFHGKSERDDKYLANRWHDAEVRNAEKAIEGKSGVSPYSRMKINHEYFEKEGIAKKVSTKEAKIRKKAAEHIVREAASKLEGVEKDHTLRGSGRQG